MHMYIRVRTCRYASSGFGILVQNPAGAISSNWNLRGGRIEQYGASAHDVTDSFVKLLPGE
jgi:hypothetical protein